MDSEVGYDIVIIGAGMAGLTAAIYCARANKKTLVLDGGNYGGQIINTPVIENFPGFDNVSGAELMGKVFAQAQKSGAEIESEQVERVTKDADSFTIETDEETYRAKAVIIATGTQNRKLKLPKEAELTGHGISSCATCDGSLYKGKSIAVYGGGNSAISEASYLVDVAEKVYLIHRREDLRASGVAVDSLRERENVEFVLGAEISELFGDDRLTGIKLSDGKELEISALFLAIGREAAVDFIEGIEKDENGYVVANEECTTNLDGVFVAGDIRTKALRQLVTAASDGAAASNSALNYLREH